MPSQEAPQSRRRSPRAGPGRRDRRALIVLAVLLPLAVSAMVAQTTQAAFTATTSSAGNSWTAGHVSLTNDAAGAAAFSVSQIVPGATGTACVTVTYTGDLGAAVRLYVPSLTGSLGSYLDIVITEGTGASDAACTGFASSGVLFTGTLAAFTAAHSAWAGGVSAWTPVASSNESRSYRIQWTLQDDNAAQGQTVTAAFTWEAHNT
jgi:hypothetical protein